MSYKGRLNAMRHSVPVNLQVMKKYDVVDATTNFKLEINSAKALLALDGVLNLSNNLNSS